MKTVPITGAALLCAAPALADAPPAYVHHVCPNGLEVIVVERHATPLMTVEIGVHNGAMTEPPEYNGLSHLYEHMFFKGNKALPDQLAYSARVRELGMLFNGSYSGATWSGRFTGSTPPGRTHSATGRPCSRRRPRRCAPSSTATTSPTTRS